jgi:hypothetical protein
VEGVNSSMIYLKYCKNSLKCYNVPPPGTTIKKKKKTYLKPGVVGHVYNSSFRETNSGGLQVRGQPRLRNETLPQKQMN